MTKHMIFMKMKIVLPDKNDGNTSMNMIELRSENNSIALLIF